MEGSLKTIIDFGSPVIAVGIGLIIAIYGLTGRYTREKPLNIWKKE